MFAYPSLHRHEAIEKSLKLEKDHQIVDREDVVKILERLAEFEDVCKVILDDATGDAAGKKRLWPIRMDNWRRLDKLVGES